MGMCILGAIAVGRPSAPERTNVVAKGKKIKKPKPKSKKGK